MTHREATAADLDLLAEWNHQLVVDERADNPMDVAHLRERMSNWLVEEGLRAVIFTITNHDVAYALFHETDEYVHLRQFFVDRDHRRQGHGRTAMHILKNSIWPQNKSLTVGVLTHNTDAYSFWREMAYEATVIKMEIPRP